MRTPVHSALPTAPSVHWLPLAGGSKDARPLPPHSISNLRDTTSKRSPEFANREFQWPTDFAVDGQDPTVRVGSRWGNSVVANEVPRRRCNLVIQEVGRRLRVKWSVVQQREAVLAIDEMGFRGQRLRHESGRHVPVKGNGSAQHSAHRREAGYVQETASVGKGSAAKHNAVRPGPGPPHTGPRCRVPAPRGAGARPRRAAAALVCPRDDSLARARGVRTISALGWLPMQGLPGTEVRRISWFLPAFADSRQVCREIGQLFMAWGAAAQTSA